MARTKASKPSAMTPAAFRFWRSTMQLTQEQAGEELGYSVDQIANFERGHDSKGKEVAIPKAVALACHAVFHRIGPWQRES